MYIYLASFDARQSNLAGHQAAQRMCYLHGRAVFQTVRTIQQYKGCKDQRGQQHTSASRAWAKRRVSATSHSRATIQRITSCAGRRHSSCTLFPYAQPLHQRAPFPSWAPRQQHRPCRDGRTHGASCAGCSNPFGRGDGELSIKAKETCSTTDGLVGPTKLVEGNLSCQERRQQ